MSSYTQLIKSSDFINKLLFISLFLAMGVFAWLGMHEFNSIGEMHHIVNSDIRQMERQLIQFAHFNESHPLHAETQAHLKNHTKNSYFMLAAIFIAAIFLGITWFLTTLYFRRLKHIQLNEHLFEELLYYNELNKIHATPNLNLPNDFKKLQLNRDAFILEVQQGLMKNQFILYYQPIVNVHTGKVVDVEALIRWQHPIYGLLAPDTFLPLCENSELIIKLGEWVLQTACHQVKKWHDMGFSKLGFSINLSARQLNDSQLVHRIKNSLAQHHISPDLLKLEITEYTLLKDIHLSIAILKSLRQIGLHLSLDDFCTGYSSLNYIKLFPINHLKIDKSFIRDITSNITSLGIVESVISLSKNLGLTIIAEGVENKNQLQILKKMKCDLVQGYLYSKPILADELTQLLHLSKAHAIESYHLPLNSPRFHYDVLSHEHYDQAVNIISHAFCAHEPMTAYLGITPQEFIPFAKLMVEKAIHDKLSVVALHHDKVAACTIVEDIANPLNITIDLDPRFKIIFSLLENLGNDFFKERLLNKNHIAHLFITAVNKNYLGYGLSREVNFESTRLAQKNGFDFMCCEFTHDYNEKGTVKKLMNNKLLIRTCIYKDFIYEDKKPFQHLEGAARAYIWELREGAKLQYQVNATH